MNKKFKEKILENYPEFRFDGGYFYYAPNGYILAGFCAEMTRNGIYLSEFLYPLFDRSDELNLNFSYRLPYPQGFIDYDQISDESRPTELVKRVSPYVDGLKSKMTLEYLYENIQANPAALKNVWIRKTYILLLILLEKYKEAQKLIENLLEAEYSGVFRQITIECSELKELLERDPRRAKRLVISWADQMKAELNLN